MRWTFFKGLALCAGLAAGAAGGRAAAEDAYLGGYEIAPVSDARLEMMELRQRLDAAEAALKRMEAKNEAGAADGPCYGSGNGECKELEIITKPTHKLFGRVYTDHLMIDQTELHRATHGDAENRTRFDTARIGVEGDVYENIGYKIELAFGEQNSTVDEPVAKDIYLELKNLAYLQNLRIGHFKEPFSLEELTSNRFIPFMERSYLNTFVPSRNIGAMAFGHVYDDETLSWYTGVFRSEMIDSPADEQEDSSDAAWTSRVAWNPYYDEPSEGRYLIHLGAGYSYREIGDDTYTISKDHELNLVFPITNPIAGTFLVDNVQLYGLEAGFVWGPLHGSSEWVHVTTNGLGPVADSDLDAFYVQAGYFLTGEHKGYRKSTHGFDRTKVLEPFFSVRTCDGVCRGWGAWELKARWSYIDANGATIAGRAEGISTGVNWYLSDYSRVMLDYIHGENPSRPATGVPAGSVNQVGIRVQFDY